VKTNVNVKIKHIYIIIHSLVKQCIYIYIILHGYVKQCKKMWFLFEEARFHNVFDDKLAKMAHCKKKKKKQKKKKPQTKGEEFEKKNGHKRY